MISSPDNSATSATAKDKPMLDVSLLRPDDLVRLEKSFEHDSTEMLRRIRLGFGYQMSPEKMSGLQRFADRLGEAWQTVRDEIVRRERHKQEHREKREQERAARREYLAKLGSLTAAVVDIVRNEKRTAAVTEKWKWTVTAVAMRLSRYFLERDFRTAFNVPPCVNRLRAVQNALHRAVLDGQLRKVPNGLEYVYVPTRADTCTEYGKGLKEQPVVTAARELDAARESMRGDIAKRDDAQANVDVITTFNTKPPYSIRVEVRPSGWKS